MKEKLPIVLFVERFPDMVVDLPAMVAEYKTIEHLLTEVPWHKNNTLVQKKLHIVKGGEESPHLAKLTYTQTIISKILSQYDFDFVTYRMMLPNTCYNWHVDPGKLCLHIPLITNVGCRFVYDTRAFNMPSDGSVYIVNNERPHTFVNAGSHPRIHLTFENL
jgi:hypothetical protein